MVATAKFQDISVMVPGFGAMSLSSHWGPSTDEQGHATLAKALEVGATFWDSAAVYGKGHNEKLIGEFFKQNAGARDKVFIASKCGFDAETGKVTNSPKHIRETITRSIESLGTKPDLYYLHRIDPDTPLEQSVGEMKKLKEEGLTRYIGLSECNADTLRKADKIAHIDALQIEYSPWYTDHEQNGLIDAARELSVNIIAYSPLGKGVLTGAITDASQVANDLRGTIPRFQGENFEQNMRLVNRFKELADKKGCTPGQLSIAWVIAQGAIPIPGTKNPERVVENTNARNVDLSEEDLKGIRQLVEEAKPVGNRYSDHHMGLVGK